MCKLEATNTFYYIAKSKARAFSSNQIQDYGNSINDTLIQNLAPSATKISKTNHEKLFQSKRARLKRSDRESNRTKQNGPHILNCTII